MKYTKIPWVTAQIISDYEITPVKNFKRDFLQDVFQQK